MAILNLLHRFTICALCFSQISWTASGDFLSSVKLTQTSKHNNQKLTELPDKILESLGEEPQGNVITFDAEQNFQEILGFGGAFTEAAALNFYKLSAEERQTVIDLYFGDPSTGGHGYTIGRVHINSCDFSPGSYSFDDVANDTSLDHFDTNVTHDSEQMIPLIKLALDRARSDGRDIRIFASPWSPPAWMKAPNPKLPADEAQSMLSSATPNGLLPEFQEVWAAYISKFIDAYARKGIELWGMTVQNEPEYAADWEACKYTAEYTRDFVKNFLGPKMEADHPELKIMVFDHNKDHVHKWAEVVYADPEAAKYIDGLAVHWYAGDFFDHMEQAHQTAPDKFLIGSEACNCPGISEGDQSWERAENLAHDILGDLNSWAVAWTDWNLLLDAQGGPNHEGNDCDANVIADPEEILGRGTVVLQPSYHYMGHFSRFIPPGSRRIFTDIQFEVPEKDLPAGELEKTEQLGMYHCDGGSRQQWEFSNGMFKLKGTDLCIDVPNGSVKSGEALQVYTCNPDNINQHFSLLTVDGAAEQITTNISQGAQGAQCVDILGIHLSEGSRVQQWQCSGGNRGLVIDAHFMGYWHLVVNGDGHWNDLDDGMWLSLWYPSGGHFMGYWRIAVNGDGHWNDLDDGIWLSLWYPSGGYCLFEGVGDSSAAGSIYVQCLGAFSPAGGLVVDSHFMGYWRIAVNGDGHWNDLDDGMWLSLWYPSGGYCLFEGVGDSSAAGSIYVQCLGAFSPAGGLVVDSHFMGYWRIAVNGDGRWNDLDDGMWLSLWYPSGGYCLFEGVGDSSAAGSIYVQCLGAFSPAGGLVIDTHFMGYWHRCERGRPLE
ncbi:hypothetical protein CYMTET_14919 [Cymbomonas tetramitiformis]|uniref:Ricin B lectin domain-containing protein n=1 Tax=Cymbomonas tetramitiformis TaxID=36881 RepID=A0AAE0L9V4_9CHLO|nr:hypothetical protein CYMTET_14919 [Cymbomonas tetramitiformis]